MKTKIVFVPVFHGSQYLDILSEPFGEFFHDIGQSGPPTFDCLQAGSSGIIIGLALVEIGVAQQVGIGIEQTEVE